MIKTHFFFLKTLMLLLVKNNQAINQQMLSYYVLFIIFIMSGDFRKVNPYLYILSATSVSESYARFFETLADFLRDPTPAKDIEAYVTIYKNLPEYQPDPIPILACSTTGIHRNIGIVDRVKGVLRSQILKIFQAQTTPLTIDDSVPTL